MKWESCLSMQKLQLRKKLSGRGFWLHEESNLAKITRKIRPKFLLLDLQPKIEKVWLLLGPLSQDLWIWQIQP